MRKKILVAAAIGLTLAAGCAKTPEEAIVKKKSGQNLENYKESEETAELEQQEEQQKEQSEESQERVNELAVRLQVPETYTASSQSEDGRFQLVCEAKVDVPDVEKVGIYKVSQLPFDDAFIAQITKGFFGETPVYDGETYSQMTKDEIMQELEILKKYQAEGNLDPYGFLAAMEESGESYDPDEVYSLQREIDNWEEAYQEAPEEKVKTVVTPSLGEDQYFSGAVEMDGKEYRYWLKAGAGDHMNIKVEQWGGDGTSWNETLYDKEQNPEKNLVPSEEEAIQRAGLTKEEAVEKTDAYMKNLGISGFSAKQVKLSLLTPDVDSSSAPISYQDAKAGYLISYTRDVDGFPVTYEGNYGGGLESMESTTEPWGYERVEFVVNKEGLQFAQILNLYQIGEKQVENVELKSFPETATTFEQMLKIKNADMEEGSTSKITIDHVTLGFMRVYDPGSDNTSGLLVPVWDFFGTETGQVVFDGEKIPIDRAEDNFSFLTINAADQTVINRSLGY